MNSACQLFCLSIPLLQLGADNVSVTDRFDSILGEKTHGYQFQNKRDGQKYLQFIMDQCSWAQ